MQTEILRFSCAELAEMNLPGLPTTRQGWIDLVQREHWPFIEQKSRGRHGTTKKYQPPQHILELIHKYRDEHPDILTKTKGIPEKEAIKYKIQATEPEELTVEDRACLKKAETVFIEPYVDVHGATGAAQVAPADQIILNLAVNDAEWRTYAGLKSKRIKVITVYGDSMKPTLQHGDQVLVDTACNRFNDDAVYLIQQDNVLRLKRIKLKLDGSIEVKSDNNHGFCTEIYSKEEAATFTVVGKVLPFKFGRFDL